jgi:integrase
MKTTYCCNFYCRNSKRNRTGDSPIELSIIINGKRCFIQLPIKCKASEFNKLLSTRKSNPIKEYCEQVKTKLTEIQLDMLKNNIPFTAENLRMYYQNGGVSQSLYTFTKLFDEYFNLIKPRINKDLSKEHYYRYLKVKSLMLDYLGKDILVEDITPAIIQGFLIYIQGKYNSSTVYGIMTRTKTIIRYAIDNGKLSKNPFQGIKYTKERKDIQYLNEDEIDRLKTKELPLERLNKVRDVSVFQLSSGLSYADLVELKKEDINYTKDGVAYIYKQRKKTGTPFVSVILPDGLKILEKYNYELPILTNQRTNSYLKEIQNLCGINKTLKTHIFRKTYATLLLNRGVRMETVSKALGHSSVKMTEQYYAKLKKETILEDIKAAF